MQSITLKQRVLFEHLFWLQILGDHSRFLFNNLSPKETPEVSTARAFMQSFDELLMQARGVNSDGQLDLLTQEAFRQASALREFKLHLLRRLLAGQIGFHFSPTFINHMLNEIEEYLRILLCVQHRTLPIMPATHHDLLWLSDAVGHATAIANGLDETEAPLIQKSEAFNKRFQELYSKAKEISGYFRTGLADFPALGRFNNEVSDKMSEFMDFLCVIKDLIMKKEVLTSLPELIPDHMLREECYFLCKLAEVAEITVPPCDPTWPRPES